MKIIYASEMGFHAIDLDSSTVLDLYNPSPVGVCLLIPTHLFILCILSLSLSLFRFRFRFLHCSRHNIQYTSTALTYTFALLSPADLPVAHNAALHRRPARHQRHPSSTLL